MQKGESVAISKKGNPSSISWRAPKYNLKKDVNRKFSVSKTATRHQVQNANWANGQLQMTTIKSDLIKTVSLATLILAGEVVLYFFWI